MPLRKQSVTLQTDLLAAFGGDGIISAVKIALIVKHNGTEFFKIEICVSSFCWFEGPLDVLDALLEGSRPLCPFEFGSDADALILGPDTSHMRIKSPFTTQKRRHAQDVPREAFAVIGSKRESARIARHYKVANRRKLNLRKFENLSLKLDAFRELIECHALSYLKIFRHCSATSNGRGRAQFKLSQFGEQVSTARSFWAKNLITLPDKFDTIKRFRVEYPRVLSLSRRPMTPRNDQELSGNFLTHPFAELIAEIAQAGLTGSLRIESGEKKYIVYFNSGRVRFAVSNSRSARLFDMLLRQKRLTADDLKQIPNFANDMEFVGYLESTGFLDRKSRERLFIDQINGILIETLTAQSGNWSFSHLNRLRDGLSFDIDHRSLLIEYARCLTVDTVLKRFRSLNESFSASDQPAGSLPLNQNEAKLLAMVSAEPATAEELISYARLAESETIRALYTLWLAGYLVRSEWNPAFSHMKVAAIRDARLELKQEAKTAFRPKVEKPVEIVEEIVVVPPAAPVLTLEDYLKRVESAETLYDVLGLEHTAELADIKRSYFSIAKAFHPDHFHQQGGSILKRVQNAFTELTHAHETLKSEITRETYDFKIRKEIAERENTRSAGTNFEQSAQFQQAAENYERGFGLLMDGEVEASLPFFARAVHFDPKSARAHAYFGKALSSDSKHRHKAEAEMQAAVKLDANNPTYRIMLAEFFIQMNLMKRAEGELNRLLAIFPNNREARLMLDSLKK